MSELTNNSQKAETQEPPRADTNKKAEMDRSQPSGSGVDGRHVGTRRSEPTAAGARWATSGEQVIDGQRRETPIPKAAIRSEPTATGARWAPTGEKDIRAEQGDTLLPKAAIRSEPTAAGGRGVQLDELNGQTRKLEGSGPDARVQGPEAISAARNANGHSSSREPLGLAVPKEYENSALYQKHLETSAARAAERQLNGDTLSTDRSTVADRNDSPSNGVLTRETDQLVPGRHLESRNDSRETLMTASLGDTVSVGRYHSPQLQRQSELVRPAEVVDTRIVNRSSFDAHDVADNRALSTQERENSSGEQVPQTDSARDQSVWKSETNQNIREQGDTLLPKAAIQSEPTAAGGRGVQADELNGQTRKPEGSGPQGDERVQEPDDFRQNFRQMIGEDRFNEYAAKNEATKATHPELKHIPVEELVAIRGYTGHDYAALNGALRSEDPSERARLEPYIKAATSGLDQLPSYHGTVYRGTNLSSEIANRYVPGEVVEEAAFTSTSADQRAAFQGNTLFVIESTQGRDVSALSEHSPEKEILFLPGSRFQVLSVDIDTVTGTREIYLWEVPKGVDGE